MFKKPKKGTKRAFRNKRKLSNDDENDDDNTTETSQLIAEARNAAKKTKVATTSSTHHEDGDDDASSGGKLMHQFKSDSSTKKLSASELATSTAHHHPEAQPKQSTTAEKGQDGIFRDKTRSKFLAGPIKAATFVRTTARFDYQPDICKDYKETGFCGFGDTCIYLHDRGDTLSGWQLEQQWEQQQKKKREQAQKEMDAFADGTTDTGASQENGDENSKIAAKEDGIPFACYICREAFTNPVVTACNHFFCEKCIMTHVRNDETGSCPICKKDTHGVFNQPTKLISKKRRLLGSKATWQEFADAAKGNNDKTSK